MKMDLNFDLSAITLLDTQDINDFKACGIDLEVKQRKHYDEYHILKKEFRAQVSFFDLQLLSRNYGVKINMETIEITER